MILKSLYGTQLWGVIRYFGNEDLTEIFEISSRYYIYNLDVIAADGKITNIYTYFPYKNTSCGEYATYDLLGSCNIENIGELFPEKIPLNYGCVIKFMAYPMIPYVLNINADREKPGEAGLEVTMVYVLGQRINFTEMYIPHSHKFWGYKDLEGKYHFMFGSLYDKQCDVWQCISYC
ncbi:Ionotropic receptor 7c [Carabus blaptoides fortunei]